MRHDDAPLCPATKAQTRSTDDAARCLLTPGHTGGHSFDNDIHLFLNEFTEVWRDTSIDLRASMLDVDGALTQGIDHYVLELFRLGQDNADAVLQNLSPAELQGPPPHAG